jgi:hypothetical protein
MGTEVVSKWVVTFSHYIKKCLSSSENMLHLGTHDKKAQE